MNSDNQTKVILEDLRKLADFLEAHNYRVADLTIAIASEDDSEFWDFLTSNSLWGGAGSIADQALIENSDARRDLEKILLRIGKAQQALDRVNVRTEMWVSFFESRSSV